MKANNIFKTIPVLFTLILVILISLNNQREKTKLTLLIWGTPESSVGTYIAISTVSGFLLSYLLTNNIAYNPKSNLKRVVKYRVEGKDEKYSSSQTIQKDIPYEQTLIERNYRDPSPTMKAEFRVIGNVEKININPPEYESNLTYDSIHDNENEYETKDYNDDDFRDMYRNNHNDWENLSFENW